ncbi:MAG: chemotaxis response regulator protein-glutamate methylesterase [Vampirovibrionales bacterium]|nr:chemotaxis response regulator protein-glutamate methylesterase [Vampirovibrionales bacterium]
MSSPLKLMIVDDTLTYRMILKNVIADIPATVVVTTANDGVEALEKLKTNAIDLVLLDVEMPRMDGIATLREIRRLYPRIGVVMVSGINLSSVEVTIKALEAGALDFVRKPDSSDISVNTTKLRDKLSPIFKCFVANQQRSSYSPNTRPPALTPPSLLQQPRRSNPPTRIDVVAIGVSTGGPKALHEVIPKLPGNLGVPILVVQHMPPVFTASLADSLNKISSLTVKEAEEGEPALPNTVYIAPGGKHMHIFNHMDRANKPTPHIAYSMEPPENSCRPAVDVLFRSIGPVYGPRVLAIIMTGMGYDGKLGVAELKKTGCYCLSQTESSCVVYGMPRAVDEAHLSDENVELGTMADRITSLILKR